jgi:hypothetical protein
MWVLMGVIIDPANALYGRLIKLKH